MTEKKRVLRNWITPVIERKTAARNTHMPINICYLNITINTLRVLSIEFSTFATGRADSYN